MTLFNNTFRVAVTNTRRQLRNLLYSTDREGRVAELVLRIFLGIRRIESQFLVVAFCLTQRARPAFLGRRRWTKRLDKEIAFIVGKGPSAQSLNTEQLALVTRSFSIALNDAIISEVEPSLRLREQWRAADGDPELLELGFPSAGPNTETLIHITVRAGAEPGREPSPPQNVSHPRTYLYSSTNFGTASAVKAAEHFVRAALRPSSLTPSVVTGSQTSLLRAIWLLLRWGYKRIVLIGCELSELPPNGTGRRLHKTAISRSPTQIPVQDLIKSISQELTRQSGPVILTSSPGGVLDGIIPRFTWSLSARRGWW
jgi:hypothetical protein